MVRDFNENMAWINTVFGSVIGLMLQNRHLRHPVDLLNWR